MQPHKRAEHGSTAQEGVCVCMCALVCACVWCACVYACVCCVQARVYVHICVLCVHTVHAGQDDRMMQRLT